jgi:hypothetical protein
VVNKASVPIPVASTGATGHNAARVRDHRALSK